MLRTFFRTPLFLFFILLVIVLFFLGKTAAAQEIETLTFCGCCNGETSENISKFHPRIQATTTAPENLVIIVNETSPSCQLSILQVAARHIIITATLPSAAFGSISIRYVTCLGNGSTAYDGRTLCIGFYNTTDVQASGWGRVVIEHVEINMTTGDHLAAGSSASLLGALVNFHPPITALGSFSVVGCRIHVNVSRPDLSDVAVNVAVLELHNKVGYLSQEFHVEGNEVHIHQLAMGRSTDDAIRESVHIVKREWNSSHKVDFGAKVLRIVDNKILLDPGATWSTSLPLLRIVELSFRKVAIGAQLSIERNVISSSSATELAVISGDPNPRTPKTNIRIVSLASRGSVTTEIAANGTAIISDNQMSNLHLTDRNLDISLIALAPGRNNRVSISGIVTIRNNSIRGLVPRTPSQSGDFFYLALIGTIESSDVVFSFESNSIIFESSVVGVAPTCSGTRLTIVMFQLLGDTHQAGDLTFSLFDNIISISALLLARSLPFTPLTIAAARLQSGGSSSGTVSSSFRLFMVDQRIELAVSPSSVAQSIDVSAVSATSLSNCSLVVSGYTLALLSQWEASQRASFCAILVVEQLDDGALLSVLDSTVSFHGNGTANELLAAAIRIGETDPFKAGATMVAPSANFTVRNFTFDNTNLVDDGGGGGGLQEQRIFLTRTDGMRTAVRLHAVSWKTAQGSVVGSVVVDSVVLRIAAAADLLSQQMWRYEVVLVRVGADAGAGVTLRGDLLVSNSSAVAVAAGSGKWGFKVHAVAGTDMNLTLPGDGGGGGGLLLIENTQLVVHARDRFSDSYLGSDVAWSALTAEPSTNTIVSPHASMIFLRAVSIVVRNVSGSVLPPAAFLDSMPLELVIIHLARLISSTLLVEECHVRVPAGFHPGAYSVFNLRLVSLMSAGSSIVIVQRCSMGIGDGDGDHLSTRLAKINLFFWVGCPALSNTNLATSAGRPELFSPASITFRDNLLYARNVDVSDTLQSTAFIQCAWDRVATDFGGNTLEVGRGISNRVDIVFLNGFSASDSSVSRGNVVNISNFCVGGVKPMFYLVGTELAVTVSAERNPLPKGRCSVAGITFIVTNTTSCSPSGGAFSMLAAFSNTGLIFLWQVGFAANVGNDLIKGRKFEISDIHFRVDTITAVHFCDRNPISCALATFVKSGIFTTGEGGGFSISNSTFMIEPFSSSPSSSSSLVNGLSVVSLFRSSIKAPAEGMYFRIDPHVRVGLSTSSATSLTPMHPSRIIALAPSALQRFLFSTTWIFECGGGVNNNIRYSTVEQLRRFYDPSSATMIMISCSRSATASPSRTLTVSRSVSQSASLPETASVSASPSATVTATHTLFTLTRSVTVSRTLSLTKSKSLVPTPSPTATRELSLSSSSSLSAPRTDTGGGPSVTAAASKGTASHSESLSAELTQSEPLPLLRSFFSQSSAISTLFSAAAVLSGAATNGAGLARQRKLLGMSEGCSILQGGRRDKPDWSSSPLQLEIDSTADPEFASVRGIALGVPLFLLIFVVFFLILSAGVAKAKGAPLKRGMELLRMPGLVLLPAAVFMPDLAAAIGTLLFFSPMRTSDVVCVIVGAVCGIAAPLAYLFVKAQQCVWGVKDDKGRSPALEDVPRYERPILCGGSAQRSWWPQAPNCFERVDAFKAYMMDGLSQRWSETSITLQHAILFEPARLIHFCTLDVVASIALGFISGTVDGDAEPSRCVAASSLCIAITSLYLVLLLGAQLWGRPAWLTRFDTICVWGNCVISLPTAVFTFLKHRRDASKDEPAGIEAFMAAKRSGASSAAASSAAELASGGGSQAVDHEAALEVLSIASAVLGFFALVALIDVVLAARAGLLSVANMCRNGNQEEQQQQQRNDVDDDEQQIPPPSRPSSPPRRTTKRKKIISRTVSRSGSAAPAAMSSRDGQLSIPMLERAEQQTDRWGNLFDHVPDQLVVASSSSTPEVRSEAGEDDEDDDDDGIEQEPMTNDDVRRLLGV